MRLKARARVEWWIMALRALKMSVVALAMVAGSSGVWAQGPVDYLSGLLGLKGSVEDKPLNLSAPPATKVRPGAPALNSAPVDPAARAARPKPASASAGKEPARANAAAPSSAKPAAEQTAAATARNTPPAASHSTAAIDPTPTDSGADLDRPARKVARLPPFRGAGSQAVCVRLCDGFFFPVNYEGAHGNDRYAEACQLACPSAATEVYFMPRGADITSASTQTGHRYSAMPNALKYRKERDASCSCKARTQSWGEVLAQAEPLIKQGKDDILVTPERSLELARPVDPAEKAAEEAKAKAPAPRKVARSKKAAKPAIATAPGTPVAPAARAAEAPKPQKTARAKPPVPRSPIDPDTTASIRRAVQ